MTGMDIEAYAAYLHAILQGLVDFPQELQVKTLIGNGGEVILSVRCHHLDMGRLIGLGGRCIHALRLILATAGARSNQKVKINIEEPYGRPRPR